MKKKQTLKAVFSSNSITLYCVIALYAALSFSVYTGSAHRQMSSMLISTSCYIVMAVSLNLVVGLLGRTVPGACRFYVGGSVLRMPVFHLYR